MTLIFWAAIFDILSIVFLLRSVIGTSWTGTEHVESLWLILIIIAVVSAIVHLLVLYYVISRAQLNRFTYYYVRIEAIVRFILLGTIAVVWILVRKPAFSQLTQGFLAFVESIVFTLVAIVFLLVGRFKNRTLGHLEEQQRLFLVVLMFTFIPLLISALVFQWLEGWTFAESWNFVNVSALTIGYGSIVPTRISSKIFLVLFGNIMLAAVAVLIATLKNLFDVRYIWRFVVILICFWMFGSLVFMFIERWTFGNSLYFVWVTLTTIGYGDFYPTTALAWEFWLLYVYITVCLLAYFIGIISDTMHGTIKKNITIPIISEG